MLPNLDFIRYEVNIIPPKNLDQKHAEQSDSLIVHYSPDGDALLIEILDASEFISPLILLKSDVSSAP